MKYLQEKIDITSFSNYKTPASAKWFFEMWSISDVEKLYQIIDWAKKQNLPVLWISGGTNMLFAFDEFPWVVIKNSLCWWTYDKKTKILETYSAESIWQIAQDLEIELGQDLWHRFIWLPWSIAGAIYGNAWCFGLETENNFLDCEVLNLENGQVSIFKKEDMDFSYRSSRIKKEKKYFIISARFDLSQKIEKYHSDVDNIDFRENKQPKWNSCGSFFKNPIVDIDMFWEKNPDLYDKNIKFISAGFLLEKSGLKWYHIWWAYFSEKHANFLMHDGTWTSKNMLDLIEHAQKTVMSGFQVMLEPEVQIISL